jgi:class 3 adenylate cyclase/tetratricopeptide (TPR) repeat protein
MSETITITIMFTDIVGSTPLRQRHGERAAHAIIAEHNEIVRRQIGEHAGHEIKTIGDSFMASFESARKAVECAVAVQRALSEHNRRNPDRPVKVRIGLHTGEAIRAGNDLFGTNVDAAARIMAKGGAEQILVSDILKSVLGSSREFGFKDRRRVSLRGFPDRWRLWEVTWRSETDRLAAEATAEELTATPGRTPYVGRAQELAALREAVVRSVSGTGGVILIGGEAGLGKTRLVEEIAAVARTRGMFVVRGHCYDMEGAPPYTPFVEAIEYGLTVTTREVFRSAMGDAGPEIARFVPKVRVAFPDLPTPVTLPGDQARHYMFESVCDFFARAAAIRPMMLVLEDLHWADRSTTELLRSIARRAGESGLLLIGTYRDVELGPHDPFMAGIEQLARLPAVTRMTLKRLNACEVAAMLSGLSGREPPERLARLVFTETEGVPFFVEEVYRHLSEENRLLDAAGDWLPEVRLGEIEVPETVRLVLGHRINRIGETAQRIMTTAACIGRTFTFGFLAELADETEDNLLDALEEAERARLVLPEGIRQPRFLFAHEQIRQTLLGRLSFVRRQRLHQRVADTMERLYAEQLDEHTSELAHHLVQAGAHNRAAKYLLDAGTAAAARLATPEALEFFGRAAELAGRGITRRAALRARGELLLGLYRGREAIDDLEQAVREAADVSAIAEEMEAQLRLGRAYYVVSLDHGPAVEPSLRALERARDLAIRLGDVRSEARALIPTHWHVDFDSNYWPAAETNAARALAIARELGDEELEIDALRAVNRTGTVGTRLANVERITLALERRGDLIALNEHLFDSMWTFWRSARFADCVACSDRATALASRLGIPPVQYGTIKSIALVDMGRFDEAWRALEHEVADENHPFGRLFQRLGQTIWFAAAGDHERVKYELPHVIEGATTLKRVWILPWAKALMAGAISATDPRGFDAEAINAAADDPYMGGMVITDRLLAEDTSAALEACEAALPRLSADGAIRFRWVTEESRVRALLALGRHAEALTASEVALGAVAPLGWRLLIWRLQAARAVALEALGDVRAAAERQEAVTALTAVAATLPDHTSRARFLAQPIAAALLAPV